MQLLVFEGQHGLSCRKTHGAGVCCIAFHPLDDHVVCTGSYDEQLRLWDARLPTTPVCRTSVCLGGGVWRAKWHPHHPNLIACAAMHAGFAVVEHKPSSAELVSIATYEGHQSLAYGVDWCHLDRSPKGLGSVVASCSFYDKLLHVWTPERL
jgi:diphthine methyl ester acylhydrolase